MSAVPASNMHFEYSDEKYNITVMFVDTDSGFKWAAFDGTKQIAESEYSVGDLAWSRRSALKWLSEYIDVQESKAKS